MSLAGPVGPGVWGHPAGLQASQAPGPDSPDGRPGVRGKWGRWGGPGSVPGFGAGIQPGCGGSPGVCCPTQ